jgi:tetratricopeptide (TPR) repeat protein
MLAAQRLTNVDCYRYRGNVYDHRGAWPLAEHAFAAGIARAPSLPQAYFSWGKALLGHQRYPAAIEKLAAAHERGPHWADPLECWAEALAAQGSLGRRRRSMPRPSGSPQPGARCTCTGARHSTNSAIAYGPWSSIALRENLHSPTQTGRPWLAISHPKLVSAHQRSTVSARCPDGNRAAWSSSWSRNSRGNLVAGVGLFHTPIAA